MKQFFLLVVTIFLFSVQVAIAQTAWKKEYHELFDYKKFSEFEAANKHVDETNLDIQLINAAIFFETNKMRALHGLEGFGFDEGLQVVAQMHSNDMVKHDFFSHTSVVRGRAELLDRMRAAGFMMRFSGENLSMRFLLELGAEAYYPPSSAGYFKRLDGSKIEYHTYLSFAEEVVGGWMNSPPHRRNILDPDFKLLGCGAAFYYVGKGIDRVPAMKCTQCFGAN